MLGHQLLMGLQFENYNSYNSFPVNAFDLAKMSFDTCGFKKVPVNKNDLVAPKIGIGH